MLLSLGAETVLIVERNMSSTDMRGAAALPGSKSKERVGNWEIPRLTTGRNADLVSIGKARSRSR